MPPFENAELVELFTAYTAGPDSIGAHLAQTVVPGKRRATRCWWPPAPTSPCSRADGSAPAIEPYRLATRGFKELAAISHLGPALATLARMQRGRPGLLLAG